MPRISADNLVKKYEEAKTARSQHEPDWRLAAAHCLPSEYAAWQAAGPAQYGGSSAAAARRIAYDSTAMRSLPKYVATLFRLATPTSQRWHHLQSSDMSLNRQRRVQEFFDTLTERVFQLRYHNKARFEAAMGETYGALGAYGTAPMYAAARRRTPLDPKGGAFYKACPLRDVFLLVDDDGSVSMLLRRFWLNARMFKDKFPNDAPPAKIANELSKPVPSEQNYFEFVHTVYVKQSEDYDEEAFDDRRFPVGGSYLSVEDKEYVGEEHGYASWPYPTIRTFTMAGSPYGFAPAAQALPAMGSASAVKKSYLKQGQRAVDQVLLAHDDAVFNGRIELVPGRVNYGAVDAQGRKLVHALESGNFQVAEKILEDERRDIEDSFFVTLFRLFQDHPEKTATEVLKDISDESALVAPTFGKIKSEGLDVLVERDIDILTELGRMPEVPPELIEADGEYDIVYTSPHAKGQYAEQVSGFLRSLEIATNAAMATENPAHLDHFDLDVAIPEISNHLAVPARWMATEAQKKALRDARQEQQEMAQAVQAAPALAGAAKAVADVQG